jgi:hypothetical protein
MKQDTDWTAVSVSYDPLILYRLIEKSILAQTEDQYPFATVYDQELSFYQFCHDNMNNPQCYERFNTKVDVGDAIGVTCQHRSLLEHVAQEQLTGTTVVTFASLTTTHQELVRKDAEERYLSYVFLRQSGPQQAKLKVKLQNDFTTGDNHYPKTRQQTLHLLDKYSKTAVTKLTNSEGASSLRDVVAVPIEKRNLSTKHIGRARPVTNATAKTIQRPTARKPRRPRRLRKPIRMMMPLALLAASIN